MGWAMAAVMVGWAGCATDGPSEAPFEDERFSEGAADGTEPPLPLALSRIASAERFDRIAFASEGTLTLGRSVKFLVDNRDPSAPTIHFMNASYTERGTTPDSARYHYNFARAILPDFTDSLDEFNRTTYDEPEKRFYAGTIQRYDLDSSSEPLYGVQFYPQDVISEQRILDVLTVVKTSFRIPSSRMGFVQAGPQQTTATVAADIEAIGFENTSIDRLLGSLRYVPMQLGEAWGYLRIFPASQDTLSATDIVVFDELPLDLTVVSGVITRAFQDASCHINLKSRERGTPDMVLREASPTSGRLAEFADRPIHLTVRAADFDIELSTEAEVERHFRERTDRPWISIPVEAETRLLSYAEMCPGAPSMCLEYNDRYGSKGANLGFLTNPDVLGRATDPGSVSARVGYDLVPAGFAVPIVFYDQLVEYAPNAALRTALIDLIEREKAGRLSTAERIAALDRVQSLFYAARLPPGMLDQLVVASARAMPGVRKIKVRSSANAEDVPHFDGAGLHDSFSVDLRERDNADGSCRRVLQADGDLVMEPDTLSCAVKGVYASLWNRRAIEERSFARLDHASVAMGLAVVARYSNESDVAANSVVVTRVLGSSAVYGYTFSTQEGNNVVTNPAAGTLAENIVAAFLDPEQQPTYVTMRYATPTPGEMPRTTRIMTDAQLATLLDITRSVEQAYCEYDPTYYDGDCRYVSVDRDKPTALDLELKLLGNGQFVCKQVREFAGS